VQVATKSLVFQMCTTGKKKKKEEEEEKKKTIRAYPKKVSKFYLETNEFSYKSEPKS
jgi:hypothetical protein